MGRYTRADEGLLAMALVGYEKEKARVEGVVAEIRAKLSRRVAGRVEAEAIGAEQAGYRQKRRLSAAARRRIAMAQKKRWAAVRKAKASKPARKLSAAGPKAIVEALRKRRAAVGRGKAEKPAPKAKTTAAAKASKKPVEQAASATA